MVDRSNRINNIRYAHSNAVYNFDQSLQAASIDNIKKFEDAYNCLSSIRYNEENSLFDGTYVYYSKSNELKNKLQPVYNTLDRKCQKIPTGTATGDKLHSKRNKVKNLLDKL